MSALVMKASWQLDWSRGISCDALKVWMSLYSGIVDMEFMREIVVGRAHAGLGAICGRLGALLIAIGMFVTVYLLGGCLLPKTSCVEWSM
jgi:hypothetical protein